MRVLSKLQLIIIASALSSLMGASVQAQSLKAVAGEYVIEPAIGSLGLSAQALSDEEFDFHGYRAKPLKNLNSLKISIGGDLGVQSTQVFSEVDPNDQTCINLVHKLKVAKSCSPNYEVKKQGETVPWGISDIDAEGAWGVTEGSDSVVVGVIDTGVDYRHEDLAANMWVNSQEIPNNGIDDDGNGYIDDIHGMNALNHSGNPLDDNGHGTHVAGTIGAIGGNDKGVIGVNSRVKIMALKFLSASGSGSLSGAIEALNYAISMKERGVNIRLTNNSWGGGGYSEPLFNAIQRANASGILFIAAAGNEANDNDSRASYPASYNLDGIVSVAAIDMDGNLASFSNYGVSTVDIAAPGVQILSTTPQNSYRTLSGTSMACPHVTGALALQLAANPALSNSQIVRRLIESGVPLESLSGIVASGRTLNVNRMLRGITSPVEQLPEPENCSYRATEVGFSPDRRGEGGQILAQGDELKFPRIAFRTKFYGKPVSSVAPSLNGVAYFGRIPSEMDYESGSVAPESSIAVLHSDLAASGDPFGIRAVSSGDTLSLYWKMHKFGGSGAAVDMWLSVAENGDMLSCYSYDSSLQSYFQRFATVGINGNKRGSAITLLRRSAGIHSGQCFRYTQVCGNPNNGGSATARRVKLSSAKGSARFRGGVRGEGDGSLPLLVRINGEQCSQSSSLELRQGRAKLTGVLPLAMRRIKNAKLEILVGDKRGSLRVHGRDFASRARRSSKRGRKLRSRLSEQAFDNACEGVFNRMHQIP